MTPTDAELEHGALDAVDEQLLNAVARLYEDLDPVPAGLVDRITFGITLDALNAEIAKLERMQPEALGARSEAATDVQTITFTSTTLTTMVTITQTGADRVRIDGWVAPGEGLLIELRIVGENRTVTADIDGRFVFDDVPHGYAQFILRKPGGSDSPVLVVTPSVEL